MANAGCINAISCDGCLIQTLQQLDSSNIGVGVQFTAPNPLDDKRLDYIKYTDKNGNTCCLTGENEILIYATNGTIKNLTLTNDDANEVVNVKRSDVFGSNWKKTVVRYKTGGYPTSITDGTLAVEELVQNQYASTGYNVSGLSDGTTYYFSAFAVAQDDTIIVVQSESITTEFFKRQPSSITVAYYKLNGNLNDSSGNNRNAIQSGGTITYPSSKYARFSSGYAKFNNGFPNTGGTTDNITISLFARNITPTGGESNIFVVGQDGTGDGRGQIIRGDNDGGSKYRAMVVSKGSSRASQATSLYEVSSGQRHHFVGTYSPANRQMKFYVDGQLKQTVSIQATMRISSVSAIGKTGNYSHSLNGDVCEIINEKALRSDEYVAKYYNKYKNIFNYT